jgi:hypothetical protein
MTLRAPALPRAQAAAENRAKPREIAGFAALVNYLLGLATCLPKARDYDGWKGMAPSRAGFQTGSGAYFLLGPEGSIPNRRRFLAEPKATTPFLLCRDPAIRGEVAMKKKIDIMTIPELDTSVGMHGSVKQTEVGGPLCLGALLAFIMAL